VSNVIKAAKDLYYNRLISNSNNKMKTTWSIIKSVIGRKINNAGIQFLNIDGKFTDNHHMITDSLNNYFLTMADKMNSNNTEVGHIIHSDTDKHLNYLSQAFTTPFLKIKFNYTSTKQIDKIINSLKSKNSNGYDEISIKILKISDPFISSPVNSICHRSLTTGAFPLTRNIQK
jgi:hypothetical protein